MRRLMIATTCAVTLFLLAGCGDEPEPTAAGTSSTAATSPAASPSPSGPADQEVCDQVAAINTEYAAILTDKFETMVKQLTEGDEAAGEQSLAELNALTAEWASKVEPLVEQSADPDLKAALGELLTGVKKLESGEGSMAELRKTVADAEAALQKYCD